MNNSIKSLILISFICIFLCCSTNDPDQNEIDMSYFYKTWINSFEEQSTTKRFIYRPEGFKIFQPSWFRMKYIFNEDNSCNWLVLAPDDAHYLQSGTWISSRYNKNSVLIHDTAGILQEDLSFVIVNLKESLLEIKPISE